MMKRFLIGFFVLFALLMASTATAKVFAVEIEEFGGFSDPYSHRFYTQTLPLIEQQYGSQVRLVFRHYPFAFQPFSQETAEASECARDQGVFRAYHNLAFENFPIQSIEQLKDFARTLNLDLVRFNACLDSHANRQRVLDDIAEGTQRGVSGTPTFFIGNQIIVGAQPLQAFQEAIENALRNQVRDQQAEPRIGPSNARVKIEAFMGFQDPFSGRFWRDTLPRILAHYPSEVQLVFTNYPFEFHENAEIAAVAGECAKAQSRFRKYADQLFSHQDALDEDNLIVYAGLAGLNVEQFSQCLDSRQFLPEVAFDKRQGNERGINGTPTFFINGVRVVGAQPYTEFARIIDAALHRPSYNRLEP